MELRSSHSGFNENEGSLDLFWLRIIHVILKTDSPFQNLLNIITEIRRKQTCRTSYFKYLILFISQNSVYRPIQELIQ